MGNRLRGARARTGGGPFVSRYIVAWNKRKLIGQISARVLQNMDTACQVVKGYAQANAPVRTGAMKAKIAVETEIVARGEVIEGRVGVKKDDDVIYARFVEFGTRKMAARPFLRPAVFDHAKEIVRIIQTGR